MENVDMSKLLEGIEERIKEASWDIAYHERKLKLAKIDYNNWTRHKEAIANGADYGL